MPGLCRDCLHWEDGDAPARRCPACGSPRWRTHPELARLSIAHIDCDAFYAAVEKRDNPALEDKPLIIGGGGQRGVVSTACYIARTYGVRSAMPMFKARAACPHAVILPPDMGKYREVGRTIRAMMLDATPLVEPLSLDEAFLDLTGTERLHKGPPALTLARLLQRIEREVRVTASAGLAPNKFLAKVASDLDKPRGFSVIGAAEAQDFLRDRPVSTIWGVGRSLGGQLDADGIRRIGDLLRFEENALLARYGQIGRRLYRFARGQDDRKVTPDSPAKSVSAETTFETDLATLDALDPVLWRMAEKLARRLREQKLAGLSLVLKLKTDSFRTVTRTRTLPRPEWTADALYRAARPLLEGEIGQARYRLLGIGVQRVTPQPEAVPDDLFDTEAEGRRKRTAAESAMEALRDRFGAQAVFKG
ncbi:MAG: DNA polymerase IV, partial [Alphaproteobacteria bacterium]|nr:DNA polymerase IV [Alphaproteobacteria bacterium]MDX5370181.1 DNA polymerase IV [Alphaproteobacteria bacterium]MDX5464743.1 DNA polymerase IV [Alphaproteobacteria bacterium]